MRTFLMIAVMTYGLGVTAATTAQAVQLWNRGWTGPEVLVPAVREGLVWPGRLLP